MGRITVPWDSRLLRGRQDILITSVVRSIMRLIRTTRILTAIGEFGMKSFFSSLAIPCPAFSNPLQLHCSAFLPIIRLQFRRNTKVFSRKETNLFASVSDIRTMLLNYSSKRYQKNRGTRILCSFSQQIIQTLRNVRNMRRRADCSLFLSCFISREVT